MKRPVDDILARLDKVRPSGHCRWMARCPAHEDGSPSLMVSQDETGKVGIHCFAGCGGSDVMEAIGLTLSDLYPERPFTERDSTDKWNPHREPSKHHYEVLQDEIHRLRAKVGT
jgi:hypothetical protein